MGIAERKEREREQRKIEIIEAAENVFFKNAYDNSTLDEVASEAELSKATLYLYFKNKEELYHAIYERGLIQLKQFFEEAISEKNNALQNIIAIGESYVKYVQTYPDYFATIMYFKGKGVDNPHEDELMQIFIRTIEQGIEEKIIKSKYSAPLLASILWAQTSGVLKLFVMGQNQMERYNLTMEEIIEAHFNINIEGFMNIDQLPRE